MIKPPPSAKPAAPEPKPAGEPDDAVTRKFIQGAPDSTAPRRVKKGRQVQISHGLLESRLDQTDQRAAALNMTRAALINMALNYFLDNNLGPGPVTVIGAGEGDQ